MTDHKMKMQMSRRSVCATHVAVAVTLGAIVLMTAELSRAEDWAVELLDKSPQEFKEHFIYRTHFCGRRLPEALSVMCSGRYRGMFDKPKNKPKPVNKVGDHVNELMQRDGDSDYSQQQPDGAMDLIEGLEKIDSEMEAGDWLSLENTFPFRERIEAADFLPKTLRRKIRGVFDECCVKGCTPDEITAYCAD